MFLNYPNKRKKADILQNDHLPKLRKIGNAEGQSKLIKGNNFDALKCLLFDFNFQNKIDLVYIDPPFATNTTFKIGQERTSTISHSHSDEVAYSDILTGSGFLEFLRERLILIRELMSNSGSIYLHIDYKIGHYVKIIMDEVFGVDNFRNDITRIKCNPKNFKRKAYGNVKDLILFYTKTNDYIWNEPKAELTDADIERLFKKIDKDGRHYTTIPLHAPGETKNGPTGQLWRGMNPPKGRHWRCNPKELEQLDKDGLVEWSSTGVPRKIIYADEKKEKGKKLQDIWEYKDPQYPTYPTQKNEAMLDLIINTSSNENSYVMDCFAGSGTTILEAQKLGRSWIGIDNSEQAIRIIKKNLKEAHLNLLLSKQDYEYYELGEIKDLSETGETQDLSKKEAKEAVPKTKSENINTNKVLLHT